VWRAARQHECERNEHDAWGEQAPDDSVLTGTTVLRHEPILPRCVLLGGAVGMRVGDVRRVEAVPSCVVGARDDHMTEIGKKGADAKKGQ